MRTLKYIALLVIVAGAFMLGIMVGQPKKLAASESIQSYTMAIQHSLIKDDNQNTFKQALWSRALEHHRQHNLWESMADYQMLIRFDSKNADAWLELWRVQAEIKHGL